MGNIQLKFLGIIALKLTMLCVITKMLNHNLCFLCDIVRMQHHVACQFLSRFFLFHLRIIFYGFDKTKKGFICCIVFENIVDHDPPYTDGYHYQPSGW